MFGDKPTSPQHVRAHSTRFVVSQMLTHQPGFTLFTRNLNDSFALLSISANSATALSFASPEAATSRSENTFESQRNVKPSSVIPQNPYFSDSFPALTDKEKLVSESITATSAITMCPLPSSPDLSLLPKVRIPKALETNSGQPSRFQVSTGLMSSSQTLQEPEINIHANIPCHDLKLSSTASYHAGSNEETIVENRFLSFS
jgi:hypothetical protein